MRCQSLEMAPTLGETSSEHLMLPRCLAACGTISVGADAKILHGSYTAIIFWYITLLNLILNSKIFQKCYLRAILSRKHITSRVCFHQSLLNIRHYALPKSSPRSTFGRGVGSCCYQRKPRPQMPFPDLSERCGNNCIGFCGEPPYVYFDFGFMLIYQTSQLYHSSVFAL